MVMEILLREGSQGQGTAAACGLWCCWSVGIFDFSIFPGWFFKNFMT